MCRASLRMNNIILKSQPKYVSYKKKSHVKAKDNEHSKIIKIFKRTKKYSFSQNKNINKNSRKKTVKKTDLSSGNQQKIEMSKVKFKKQLIECRIKFSSTNSTFLFCSLLSFTLG